MAKMRIPVRLLTPTVVGKYGSQLRTWEAQTMELVRTQTSVPVPRIHRVVEVGKSCYIFMDYIPGQTLEECWPHLSIWRKLWVAWKLRSYIRQLRHIKLPQIEAGVPGPLTDDICQPKGCDNPAFGEFEAGPFSSYDEFILWLNGRFLVAWRFRPLKGGGTEPDILQADAPLVVTHGDLVPRNIILGDDGKLWVLDWGASGIYPIWLEYATMMRSAVRKFNTNSYVAPSWFRLIRFVCGVYDKQYRFVERITFAVTELLFVPAREAIPDDWK
ncbi:hypothetical protein QCA50_000960 [Cerrena zonata]|uniref:Aminoglycoside phosphotransferase domain-containing protein n=1 Tax=Cerrena zonata TaxID=2478898 RepID=A0AAW0GS12_9APHY